MLNVPDLLIAKRANERVNEVGSGVGFSELYVARRPVEVLDGL
jgi:hypothetical protein